MKRLRRALRRLWGRLFGRAREVPAAPERLVDEVRLFRRLYASAGVEEWERFAVRLASAAYREGYASGLASERLRAEEDEGEPEIVRRAREWRLSDVGPRAKELLERGDPNDPLAGLEGNARVEALDWLGQIAGTHRVVVLSDEDIARGRGA